MEALITVAVGTILSIMLSYNMYVNGYKRTGVQLLRGTVCFSMFYAFMVLIIGLAPMH